MAKLFTFRWQFTYAGNDVYFEGKPYSNEILIKNRFAVVGGGMFNIADLIYPRIGIGYGERYACYKDLDKNYDISGVSLDAGLTFKLGSVALSAGVLTTAFETTDMVLGIGFMF